MARYIGQSLLDNAVGGDLNLFGEASLQVVVLEVYLHVGARGKLFYMPGPVGELAGEILALALLGLHQPARQSAQLSLGCERFFQEPVFLNGDSEIAS